MPSALFWKIYSINTHVVKQTQMGTKITLTKDILHLVGKQIQKQE
jgi:hypothetical protein